MRPIILAVSCVGLAIAGTRYGAAHHSSQPPALLSDIRLPADTPWTVRVVVGSVRFPLGSDARFAAAARTLLPGPAFKLSVDDPSTDHEETTYCYAFGGGFLLLRDYGDGLGATLAKRLPTTSRCPNLRTAPAIEVGTHLLSLTTDLRTLTPHEFEGFSAVIDWGKFGVRRDWLYSHRSTTGEWYCITEGIVVVADTTAGAMTALEVDKPAEIYGEIDTLEVTDSVRNAGRCS